MEATVYNQLGKKATTISLPASVFGLPWNADLVHQVMESMRSNLRNPIAHAKDRSEVRGGGKKPWKQKGTGQARHGSIRSPIWVGGGKAHGPTKLKNYSKKINKKMKAKALLTVLSQKFRDGEIIFVDTLSFTEAKTKNAKTFLDGMKTVSGFEKNKKKNKAYIALAEKNEAIKRMFGNLAHVEVDELRNINALDALNYKYVIMTNPEASISLLQSKMKEKATA
jgi:large subunit ribosomal protein L4